jgi:hypothetical protein
MTHRKSNYTIGRGKPPTHSRWPKGKSGNPGGRRKNVLNHRTVLEKVLLEPVTVTEGGSVKKMTLFEVGLRALAGKAAKGDIRALRFLVQLSKETADDKEARQPIEITISSAEAALC